MSPIQRATKKENLSRVSLYLCLLSIALLVLGKDAFNRGATSLELWSFMIGFYLFGVFIVLNLYHFYIKIRNTYLQWSDSPVMARVMVVCACLTPLYLFFFFKNDPHFYIEIFLGFVTGGFLGIIIASFSGFVKFRWLVLLLAGIYIGLFFGSFYLPLFANSFQNIITFMEYVAKLKKIIIVLGVTVFIFIKAKEYMTKD